MERRKFLSASAAVGTGAVLMSHGAAELHASVLSGQQKDQVTVSFGPVSATAFCTAATTGDTDAVSAMLQKDPALLYARDTNGMSAYLLASIAGKKPVTDLLESKGIVLDFHEAVAGGKNDRIKELLAQSPDVIHLPNAFGDTPMHIAALCQRSGVVSQVQWGSRFDVPNFRRRGMTAAHLAVQAADEGPAASMAQSIFGNGTDPNLKTEDGDTCMHLAAVAGHPLVIELLVRRGASLQAKNAGGETALDVARKRGNPAAVKALEGAERLHPNYYGKRFTYSRNKSSVQRDDRSGLPVAWINEFVVFSHFNFDKVKEMLGKSPDLLNTRSTWDELPVEAAAHLGNEPIATYLLEKGAPYSICTAAMLGDKETVKAYLAEDKQRIWERGAHDFPLIWYPAFGKEQVEAAELLVAAGADVRVNMRGRSALHIAAEKGQIKMVELLLAHGADPNLKGVALSGESLTAAEAADKSKHPEVADFLRKWRGSSI